jgi:hypothetical protein
MTIFWQHPDTKRRSPRLADAALGLSQRDILAAVRGAELSQLIAPAGDAGDLDVDIEAALYSQDHLLLRTMAIEEIRNVIMDALPVAAQVALDHQTLKPFLKIYR